MSVSFNNYTRDAADAIIWVKVNVTFPWQAVAGCWGGGGVSNLEENGALRRRRRPGMGTEL
jgi:hypothetical protein